MHHPKPLRKKKTTHIQRPYYPTSTRIREAGIIASSALICSSSHRPARKTPSRNGRGIYLVEFWLTLLSCARRKAHTSSLILYPCLLNFFTPSISFAHMDSEFSVLHSVLFGNFARASAATALLN